MKKKTIMPTMMDKDKKIMIMKKMMNQKRKGRVKKTRQVTQKRNEFTKKVGIKQGEKDYKNGWDNQRLLKIKEERDPRIAWIRV